MTTPGPHFEIKVDGVPRTYRDFRETANRCCALPAGAQPGSQDRRHRPARRIGGAIRSAWLGGIAAARAPRVTH